MKLKSCLVAAGMIATIALLVVSCSGKNSASSTKASAASAQQAPAPFRSETHGNVTFQWRVNRGGTMDCVLSAPTTGWVAVGWGHDGTLKSSEIIIGSVKEGQATIVDAFGVSADQVKLVTDLGNDDIISNKSGSVDNGTTKLQFTLQMHAIGDYHDPLNSGQTYEFIFLHGPAGAQDLSTFPGSTKPVAAEIVL